MYLFLCVKRPESDRKDIILAQLLYKKGENVVYRYKVTARIKNKTSRNTEQTAFKS